MAKILAKDEITIFHVVDLSVMVRYYLLQASTLSTPAKPTSFPPSDTWTETEPAYVEGSTNSLYFTDCTVFSDGSWKYSEVSLSSSYEAAKQAYNKANAAQGAVTTLETKVNTAIEKYDNYVNIMATKEEVESIQIGGRNLIVRSTSQNDHYVATDGNITGYSGCGSNTTDYISVTPNTEYTFSKEAGGSTSYGDYFRLAWYNASKTYVGRGAITDIPAYEAGYYTWTSPSDAYFIKVSYPADLAIEAKLEKGNKATDWTPAPEDVDAEIDTLTTRVTNAENAINVNTENITLTASKTEVAQATADAAQADIDNLSIGGRNYLLDSATSKSITATGGTNITGAWYNFAPTVSVIETFAGKTVTFSFECEFEGTNTDGRFHIQFGNPSYASAHPSVNISDIEPGKRYSYTRTFSSTPTDATSLRCRTDEMTGTLTIIKPKLEIGNRATDWTPAPEDLEAATAAVATDLATNYYTITQTDAAITESSEAISLEVSKVNSKVLATRLDLAEAWEQGSHHSTVTAGTTYSYNKVSMSNRIRTAELIPVGGPVYAEWNDDTYDLAFHRYDENKLHIGSYLNWRTSSPCTSSVEAAYIVVVLRHKDSTSAITPSEATAAAVKVGKLSDIYATQSSLNVTNNNISAAVNRITANETAIANLDIKADGISATVSSQQISKTVSGTDGVYIPDATANAKLVSAEADGAYEQFTTTGKNLLSMEADDFTNLNNTTSLGDGWWRMSCDNTSGTSEKYCNLFSKLIPNIDTSKTYYAVIETKTCTATAMAVSSAAGTTYDQFVAKSATISANSKQVVTLTPRDTASYTPTVGLRSFISVPAGTSHTVDVRISLYAESVTASTFVYEPYTGAIPSPNPDYPQEIETVTEASLVVSGKNLVPDGEKSSAEYLVASYLPVVPLVAGETYTVTMDVTPAAGITRFGPHMSQGMAGQHDLYPSGTSRQTLSCTWKPSYYKDQTPDKNINYAYYQVFRYPNDGTVTGTTTIHRIQIEKGSSFTGWSSHTTESIPIDLQGNEICELPDGTKDKLTIDSAGNVSLVKNVDTVNAADLGWWLNKTRDVNGVTYNVFSTNDFTSRRRYSSGSGTSNFLCDRFPYRGNAQQSSLGEAISFNSGTYSEYAYIQTIQASTESGFKTWLTNNETLIYYPLAESNIISLGKITMPKLPEEISNVWISSNLSKSVEFEYITTAGGAVADAWNAADEDINTAQETADSANETIGDMEGRLQKAESLIQQLSDSISTLVTDGNGTSLMTQTSTGWTFNMGGTLDALDGVTDGVNNLTTDVDTAEGKIANLEAVTNALSQYGNYITMDEDSNGPYIELGSASSDFKVRITNTAINFLEGTAIPARINNEMLEIDSAVVNTGLKIGGFEWTGHGNGSMGLVWRGV